MKQQFESSTSSDNSCNQSSSQMTIEATNNLHLGSAQSSLSQEQQVDEHQYQHQHQLHHHHQHQHQQQHQQQQQQSHQHISHSQPPAQAQQMQYQQQQHQPMGSQQQLSRGQQQQQHNQQMGPTSSGRHLQSGIGQQCSSGGSIKKELPANGKKTKGRVRIKMEFIHNKLRRYTTFSKRKTGIMKKAFELATLTGTQVMLLVASETGHVYTFATKKLQPMIISDAGKALIQTCLNSPDSDNLLMSASSASGQRSGPSPSSLSTGDSSPSSSRQQQHQLQPLEANQQQHQQRAHSHQVSPPISPASQQQQHHYNAGQQNQVNLSAAGSTGAHLCQAIQSQHNMLLASSTSNLATSSSSSSNSNTSSNSSSSNTSQAASAGQANNQSRATSNGTTNANHSTTDQRMSATGFEETELSYSINDDLNERINMMCEDSILATTFTTANLSSSSVGLKRASRSMIKLMPFNANCELMEDDDVNAADDDDDMDDDDDDDEAEDDLDDHDDAEHDEQVEEEADCDEEASSSQSFSSSRRGRRSKPTSGRRRAARQVARKQPSNCALSSSGGFLEVPLSSSPLSSTSTSASPGSAQQQQLEQVKKHNNNQSVSLAPTNDWNLEQSNYQPSYANPNLLLAGLPLLVPNSSSDLPLADSKSSSSNQNEPSEQSYSSSCIHQDHQQTIINQHLNGLQALPVVQNQQQLSGPAKSLAMHTNQDSFHHQLLNHVSANVHLTSNAAANGSLPPFCTL